LTPNRVKALKANTQHKQSQQLLCTAVFSPVSSPVYTIQPVVKQVWQPVWQSVV